MNDATVVLTCTIADCEIGVNVDFRFANPEWMCHAGLMSGLSQDLIITTGVSPKILGAKWKYEVSLAVFVSYRLNLEYPAMSAATTSRPQLSKIKQMHGQVLHCNTEKVIKPLSYCMTYFRPPSH